MRNPIKRFGLLLVPVLMALVPAAPAKGNDHAGFLYPAGKVSVRADIVRLIGRAPPGRESVTLRVRYGKKEARLRLETKGSYFAEQLALGSGANRLELLDPDGNVQDVLDIFREDDVSGPPPEDATAYYLHPKEDYAGRCSACHKEAGSNTGVPAYAPKEENAACITSDCHGEYPAAPFPHGAIGKGACTGCHNPHGTTNPGFLKALRGDLCYSCHENLRTEYTKKVVHLPVEKGECLSCHDPHGSDFDFHLRRHNMKDLCGGCHGYDTSSYKTLHGPVKSGGCTACHNPHVSDYPGLLFENGNTLCLLCHEVRKDEFNREHVHEPVKKDCTLCHNPHGSDQPFHLQITAAGSSVAETGDEPFMKQLCLSCHEKENPDLTRQIRTAPVRHGPVAEGKCLECHTPHSTNFRKQLKKPAKQLCLSCHKEMAKQLKESRFQHGPVAKGCCPDCHQVHGGFHPKLLANRFEKLSPKHFEPERVALCFNCHEKKVYTDENNLATGFRKGKRNLHYWHVNKTIIRSCDLCHDIHASSQEKHIRPETIFRGRYRYKIDYEATPTGGRCVSGCHRPRRHEYDRNDEGN